MMDSPRMDRDFEMLRSQARKAIECGTVSGKTDAEIRQEIDDMLVAALTTVVRHYDPEFAPEQYDMPEILYGYLWQLICQHIYDQTGKIHFYDDALARLDDEVAAACNTLIVSQ